MYSVGRVCFTSSDGTKIYVPSFVVALVRTALTPVARSTVRLAPDLQCREASPRPGG
jgi:hypothetical protein